MNAILHRSKQFLDMELGFGPRALLVVAAMTIAATLVFPLWKMTMFAPQYPNGLRREHRHLPQRKNERGGNRHCRHDEQRTRPESQLHVEELFRAVQNCVHEMPPRLLLLVHNQVTLHLLVQRGAEVG